MISHRDHDRLKTNLSLAFVSIIVLEWRARTFAQALVVSTVQYLEVNFQREL